MRPAPFLFQRDGQPNLAARAIDPVAVDIAESPGQNRFVQEDHPIGIQQPGEERAPGNKGWLVKTEFHVSLIA
jgi:hypothetical protein